MANEVAEDPKRAATGDNVTAAANPNLAAEADLADPKRSEVIVGATASTFKEDNFEVVDPAKAATPGDAATTDAAATAAANPADKPLTPEQQKQLDEQMTKFNAELAAQNFTLNPLTKGQGPYQSIEAMSKAGKLPEGFTHQDILSEARRIRDRDFADLGRNYYKVGEAPVRWNEKELEQKKTEAEAKFKENILKEAAEAEQRAKEAQEQAAREAAAKQAMVESSVPNQDNVAKALTASGADFGMDAAALRGKLLEEQTKGVDAGSVTADDLAKKAPKLEQVYLATGALTPEQLTEAQNKQREQTTAATETEPEKVPALSDVVKKMLEGNADQSAKAEAALKFHGELAKVGEAEKTEEAARKSAAEARTNEFIGSPEDYKAVFNSAEFNYGVTDEYLNGSVIPGVREQINSEIQAGTFKLEDMNKGDGVPTEQQLILGASGVTPEQWQKVQEAKAAEPTISTADALAKALPGEDNANTVKAALAMLKVREALVAKAAARKAEVSNPATARTVAAPAAEVVVDPPADAAATAVDPSSVFEAAEGK